MCRATPKRRKLFFVRARCLSVGRSWILLTEQRGIAPPAVCQRHKSDAKLMENPLCPLANPFCGFCCLGSCPFVCLVCCFSWRNANLAGGFAGRLGCVSLVLFGVVWFACIYGPSVSLYKCSFDSLCSCKDRATVRYRPNSRKKKDGDGHWTVDPFGKIATDLDALGWTMEYGCDLWKSCLLSAQCMLSWVGCLQRKLMLLWKSYLE